MWGSDVIGDDEHEACYHAGSDPRHPRLDVPVFGRTPHPTEYEWGREPEDFPRLGVQMSSELIWRRLVGCAIPYIKRIFPCTLTDFGCEGEFGLGFRCKRN